MTTSCAVCGKPIDARRSTRRYCSARCRLAHYRNPGLSVSDPAVMGLWAQAVSVATPAPLSPSTPSVSEPAASSGAALAAIAAGIATPTDGYGPARAYCEFRDGGFGVVFGMDAGRHNAPVGPTFLKPRTAVDLAELLNGRLSA